MSKHIQFKKNRNLTDLPIDYQFCNLRPVSGFVLLSELPEHELARHVFSVQESRPIMLPE